MTAPNHAAHVTGESAMPRLNALLARACVLACLLSPVFARAQSVDRLRIHGSATMAAQTMPAIVRAWLRDTGYTGLRERRPAAGRQVIAAVRDGQPLVVEIVGNGTAQGFADLVDQSAELAMATRAPTAAERDAAWQLGDLDAADQAFTVALGGLQFVVDARSPVRALSVAQLRDVYTGRTTAWSAFGGPNRPIHAMWSGPDTATGELLRSAVVGGADVVASRVPASARIADPDMLRALPLGMSVPPGQRAIAVSDGGVAVPPDRVGVLSEDYPLVRRHALYGGPMMSALGRSLALYAVGYRGQRAVEACGAIAVMLHPVRGTTPALAPLAGLDLRGATRLAVSLRFHPEGMESLFDARAVRDLERIDRLMHAPAMRGRALMVVAFADRQHGGRLLAQQLANDRADLVAGLLLQRGLRVVRAHGAGDAVPLSAAGDSRHRNERIELWLM